MNVKRVNRALNTIHEKLDIIHVEVSILDNPEQTKAFYDLEVGILKSIRRFRKEFGIVDEVLNATEEEEDR